MKLVAKWIENANKISLAQVRHNGTNTNPSKIDEQSKGPIRKLRGTADGEYNRIQVLLNDKPMGSR